MKRVDPYPSRTAEVTGVLPRRDPVVYGRAGAGPLSREELDRYERRGFLCFDALLEPAELDALVEEALRLAKARCDDPSPEVVREPDSDEVRSIFEVHRGEGPFRSLVRHPRLIAMAEQILGGRVYLHQSRINYKPAFRGRPFHWHSDFETWHLEDGMPRMRAASLSLSLTANRPDNGPLMLIPGSHHSHVCCPGETPPRHYERSLRRQIAGVPPADVVESFASAHGVESPTGPPGSATLFDCNMLHGSNGNTSPFPRTNVFVVFNSVENALEEPYSGQPPRPRYIASRDVTPLP